MPAAWKPKDLLVDPRDFGRPGHTGVWPATGDPDRRAAGWQQHRVAQGVNADLASTGWTLDLLAAETGETPDYVRSKLYGHQPASIEDLMCWVRLFGAHILPPLDPASYDELLPPAGEQ